MLKNSSSSSVYLMQCCTVALNSAQCDSQCPAVKCGLANAATAGQTGRGGWNAPTAAREMPEIKSGNLELESGNPSRDLQ